MEKKTALELVNVSKTYTLSENSSSSIKERIFNLFTQTTKTRQFDALKNINLKIYQGETFGIIGRNGSGKSTLTKIMAGTYPVNPGGVVKRNGTVMLMNLGVGMSHELTARQNIYISGSALGMRRKWIDENVDRILAFAELEDFADSKIKYFSSGMVQRLSFSIAVNAGADIMFLDEVFAVGDEKFRQKAVQVMEKNWLQDRTVIMVSHGLQNISRYCDRCAYLHKGELKFVGPPDEAIRLYREDLSNEGSKKVEAEASESH